MSHFAKHLINQALRPFNQEIVRRRKAVRELDAYDIQARLTTSPAPVIFDVGAYIGDMAARYRALFPQGAVHAFEPFPGTFRKLSERFSAEPGFVLNPCAVGDNDGAAEFHVNPSSATNSLLASDPCAAQTWGPGLLETEATVSVPVITLDTYCRTRGIAKIDVLKLDVQGAELKALHGARESLSRGTIKLIYMELIFAPTYLDQPDFDTYLTYLRSLGYTLLDLYNPLRKEFRLVQADAIFVRGR